MHFRVVSLFLLPVSLVTAAAFDPSTSPFANKPVDSYSNHKSADGKDAVMLWGQAPYLDFGSRPVEFDLTGVRKLPPAPAPGVHPRIFFGPAQLPDVRRRLKETRTGQEAWKNILSWTAMMKGEYDDKAEYAQPDRWNGGFGGLHGRVPLFRLGLERVPGKSPYNRSEKAAEIYRSLVDGTATTFPDYYWNVFALEAFRCLIEDDKAGAETLAKAVLTAMRIDQAKRDIERKQKNAVKPPEQPVGRFQLAFCYDFLFNWLTPLQKKAMHDELAATTWSHDNYGTFNTAESSRSNWATFSYWLYEVLAIEGEEGFNDLKVRGMYRGWRNLLTYGWFPSGATFEGEAKNQLGMDGIILFTMRAPTYGFENLSGHPYLQAYAKKFLPQSINPMQTGFHKYDLLGGSRAGSGGFAPMDSLGLKFMFPDDKVVDWYYRKTIGENYEGVPDRPDGYFNALLFYAINAADFDPANNDPSKLALGNTFFCGERALMMTRSGWDKDAMMLNMHTRQANGGHPFSDRNAIMVAGAGRIWSPNGYATFTTPENSVVSIDGRSQNEIVPGRCVDFVETPLATFMVGDAKYTWDWDWKRLEKSGGFYTVDDVRDGKVVIPAGWEPVLHSVNDFAFQKLPYDYLNWPHFQYAHWILPKGALSPYVRQPKTPVRKAFRTAGLVRGERPYAVVIDDIRRDDAPHRYDWTMGVEYDIQIVKTETRADGATEVILTGGDPDQKLPRPKSPLPSSVDPSTKIPDGQPMLLVTVLGKGNGQSKPPAAPEIVELPNKADPKKYAPVRRLVIPSESVSPDFKVLLVPYRQGEQVPRITWNNARQTAVVTSGTTADTISFRMSNSGKTDVAVRRKSGDAEPVEIIRVDRAIAPLADALAVKRAEEDARIRAWVAGELAGFKPQNLEGLVAYWDFEALQDGKATAVNAPIALDAAGAVTVPGKVGQALKFAGASDGIRVPVDAAGFAPGGFSIAFWARDLENKRGGFVANNGNRGFSLGIENISLRVDTDSTHRWRMLPWVPSDWQHVALTYDGKTVRLYLGGKEVAAGETSKPLAFSKETSLARNFSGELDELLIFQRALTPEEIQKIHAVQAFAPGLRG